MKKIIFTSYLVFSSMKGHALLTESVSAMSHMYGSGNIGVYASDAMLEEELIYKAQKHCKQRGMKLDRLTNVNIQIVANFIAIEDSKVQALNNPAIIMTAVAECKR